MKKLFLLLILTLNSLLLSAQSHITFKGIPVDGHVSMFVEKLPQFGITECLIQYKCSVNTPPPHAIRSG